MRGKLKTNVGPARDMGMNRRGAVAHKDKRTGWHIGCDDFG